MSVVGATCTDINIGAGLGVAVDNFEVVDIGFEKMTLKQNTLRCYFVNNPDSPYFESATFQKLLQFVQQYLNKAQLKQNGKLLSLVINDVVNMNSLHDLLKRMHAFQQQEIPAK